MAQERDGISVNSGLGIPEPITPRCVQGAFQIGDRRLDRLAVGLTRGPRADPRDHGCADDAESADASGDPGCLNDGVHG